MEIDMKILYWLERITMVSSIITQALGFACWTPMFFLYLTSALQVVDNLPDDNSRDNVVRSPQSRSWMYCGPLFWAERVAILFYTVHLLGGGQFFLGGLVFCMFSTVLRAVDLMLEHGVMNDTANNDVEEEEDDDNDIDKKIESVLNEGCRVLRKTCVDLLEKEKEKHKEKCQRSVDELRDEMKREGLCPEITGKGSKHIKCQWSDCNRCFVDEHKDLFKKWAQERFKSKSNSNRRFRRNN